LMDIQNLFRRDQIWFVEKWQYWESNLYWLLEFKDKTRKDVVLEKNYYKGRYWALPNFIWDNLFLDQEVSNGKI
jgi:AAA15 family ATPase/GTPase